MLQFHSLVRYAATSLVAMGVSCSITACAESTGDDTAKQQAAKRAEARAQRAQKEAAAWAFTPDPKLPNVLILGDSISIGYTLEVRKLLAGQANVFRPMGAKNARRENCGGTTNGVANIDRWLADEEWSVIHFNFGLHDLKHVKTAGGNEKSNDANDPTQASLEQYTKNMKEIVAKLKATDAVLVFATTTPVVPGTQNPLRDPLAPGRYNAAAVEIMAANEIRVNDLYEYCVPHLDEWQLPKNVHFRPEGSKALAKQVAKAVEEALATALAE